MHDDTTKSLQTIETRQSAWTTCYGGQIGSRGATSKRSNGRNGILLNPEKFVFSALTVVFAGFTITMTDVRPCSRYLESIRDFPEPRNITDVRSWFGLVNQVAYAFSMAERIHPFRKLLNRERFTWLPGLEDIFRESKVIVQEIERGVRIFYKAKLTYIATGWSKEGILFWLF